MAKKKERKRKRNERKRNIYFIYTFRPIFNFDGARRSLADGAACGRRRRRGKNLNADGYIITIIIMTTRRDDDGGEGKQKINLRTDSCLILMSSRGRCRMLPRTVDGRARIRVLIIINQAGDELIENMRTTTVEKINYALVEILFYDHFPRTSTSARVTTGVRNN